MTTQPELPGMPEPAPASDAPPRTTEKVTVSVYPPSEPRTDWLVSVWYEWPGGTSSRHFDASAAITPKGIMAKASDIVAEMLLDLEPF